MHGHALSPPPHKPSAGLPQARQTPRSQHLVGHSQSAVHDGASAPASSALLPPPHPAPTQNARISRRTERATIALRDATWAGPRIDGPIAANIVHVGSIDTRARPPHAA